MHRKVIKIMRPTSRKWSKCLSPADMQRSWSQVDETSPRSIISACIQLVKIFPRLKLVPSGTASTHSFLWTPFAASALENTPKYHLCSFSLSVTKWQHFYLRKLKKKLKEHFIQLDSIGISVLSIRHVEYLTYNQRYS